MAGALLGALWQSSCGRSVTELDGRYVLAATVLVRNTTEKVEVLALDGKLHLVAEFEGQRPLWSPDGRLLAFGRYRDATATQVWLSDPWGRHQRQLTIGPSAAWHTSWSPRSEQVHYETVEGGLDALDQVWSVDVDTGYAHHLSDRRATEKGPIASPDGVLIAYERQRSTDVAVGPRDIWVMRSDGSDAHPVAYPAQRFPRLVWSSDGRWIFYNSTEGTDPRALAQLDQAEADGRIPGLEDLRRLGVSTSVYRVHPDGTSRTLVIRGRPVAVIASASRAGDHIAYEVWDARNGAEICVARGDGTGARNVSNQRGDDSKPAWSPDGKMLAWLRPGTGPDSGIVLCELGTGRHWVAASNTRHRAYTTSLDWRPVK